MRNWIEKQRNIIDFTLSLLARRKAKSVALFLTYAGLVFLLASVMFLTHSLQKEALLLQNAPELVVQRLRAGRQDLLPGSYLDTIRNIKGVCNVRGRLWGYYFDPSARANYTLMVPEKFPSGEGTTVVGQGISRINGAFPGDILPIRGYDGKPVNFTISSVLSPDSEILSSDLMLISEKDFIALFHIPPDHFTDLTLTVGNTREVPIVAAEIGYLLPDTRSISKSEILKTYENMFDWHSGIVMVILSATILAFAVFALDKASGLSVEEKKEIGILKAIGWNTSDVLLMKFWEGAMISLCAFLNGVILAYIHVFLTPLVLFTSVLKGWSVFYPNFNLTPFIDPYHIAILFFLTVIPYTAATIVPSWRSAAIDPDSVMKT